MLAEMAEISFFLGAQRLLVGEFIYSGKAVIHRNEIMLSAKDKENYTRCLGTIIKEYTKRMEIISATDPSISMKMRCAEPNQVLLVRPNGDVKFDCIWPFVLGNVRKNTLREIWDDIGKYVCQDSRVIEFIKKIKCADDLYYVKPRTYVDEPILL